MNTSDEILKKLILETREIVNGSKDAEFILGLALFFELTLPGRNDLDSLDRLVEISKKIDKLAGEGLW